MATTRDPAQTHPTRLVAIALGITAVIALMLLAFVTPAISSGAKDLPLAVSGPPAAVAQVTAALDKQSPGTFEVTPFATPDEAAESIRDRDAIGGIAVGPDAVTIQTAAAAGAPYAATLRGVGTALASTGQTVTYDEIVPLTADDPTGSGITALGLPLIFGGMATAAALVLGYRGSTTARVLTALAVSALAGLTATALLQQGFGALDGSYWLTSAAVAAGVAAISLTVLGLGLLLGTPGIGLGAVLMLFVSNPLSGMATGWQWLPQPWGAIGQYLPLGAAGTAIRSAAFFDGRGTGTAWLVLGAWVVLGLVLALAGGRRRRRLA